MTPDFLPLPRGTTGFFLKGEPPPPRIYSADFRALIDAWLDRDGVEILGFDLGFHSVVKSYYQATVQLDGDTVLLLASQAFRWIGACAASPFYEASGLNLNFIDLPERLGPVPEPWRAIPAAILDQPVEGVDHPAFAQLGEAERLQIHRRRPERIGDVIFNIWD